MIRVRQIFIDIDEDFDNTLKKAIAKKLKININEINEINLNKKALDARKNKKIHYVVEVDIKVKNETKILSKNISKDIFQSPIEKYDFKPTGTKKLTTRPIIVGAGPAGLFCAYLLAENGYNPLIIERGEKIEERIKTVNKFWEEGILNESSNVQFGEGGAGTFSDGKLNTLVKDKNFRMKKVFEIFISCGAPKEILYTNNPHIGTDLLRDVVKNIRNKIIEMGGEFKFNRTLTNIIIENNKIKEIVLNDKEKLPCDNLILAIGHSARDTFKMLYRKGINMTNKPFAVGIRIVHDQQMISKNQYGESYKKLPPANYKLTYTTKTNRGVYSFCMCPGGYVVNSSSLKDHLVINGMSNYNRDSGFANSAIVVSVSKDDFGSDIFDGINFQEKLEKKAYELGNGNIPVQLLKDFEKNKVSNINNNYSFIKGNYKSANLNNLFPEYITNSLIEGINNFDQKIPGFAKESALILGVESRTSSPIKILRNEHYMSNIYGIYPCGEGAGYAGGITTSSMDGIKVAEALASIYKANNDQ